MKLDPDLIKNALLFIEGAKGPSVRFTELLESGCVECDATDLHYHLWQLGEREYIGYSISGGHERLNSPVLSKGHYMGHVWLRPDGHDLIADLQTPGTFDRIKHTVMEKGLHISLTILTTLAGEFAKRQILGTDS